MLVPFSKELLVRLLDLAFKSRLTVPLIISAAFMALDLQLRLELDVEARLHRQQQPEQQRQQQEPEEEELEESTV